MDRFCTLNKSDLPQFFVCLQSFGQVYAPRPVSEQSFAYKAVNSVDEISMTALRTILPAKKFFYPGNEEVLRYQNSELIDPLSQSADGSSAAPRQVVFGIHPCELAGIAVLDKIFAAQPADHHYLLRRKNTLLVGTGCMPDQHCFCKSTGTDMPESAYDLFLTDLGDELMLQVRTPLGESVVSGLGCLQDVDAMGAGADVCKDKYQNFYMQRAAAFTAEFDGEDLAATLDETWHSPVWEELGSRCLSCGNCTPVCPTCYCFDLVDVAELDGSASRHREWDSCQIAGFAGVAGGFNFRPTPVDRLKFWYRHKLYGFEDPYGFPTCIGCGRCTVSCPAGIDDIVGMVKRLQSEARSPQDGN